MDIEKSAELEVRNRYDAVGQHPHTGEIWTEYFADHPSEENRVVGTSWQEAERNTRTASHSAEPSVEEMWVAIKEQWPEAQFYHHGGEFWSIGRPHRTEDDMDNPEAADYSARNCRGKDNAIRDAYSRLPKAAPEPVQADEALTLVQCGSCGSTTDDVNADGTYECACGHSGKFRIASSASAKVDKWNNPKCMMDCKDASD